LSFWNESWINGNNLWVTVRELNNNLLHDTKEKINDLGVRKSSVKLFPKGTILFSFKLSIGKMGIVGNPMYSNEAIAGINTKDSNYLTNKYIFYFLGNLNFNVDGIYGKNHGSLNKKSIYDINIKVPTLDLQNKIVERLDAIQKQINQLNNEIEDYRKEAKLLLDHMLQSNKPDNNSDNKPTFKPSIKDMDLDDLQSKVDDEDEKIRLTDEECIDIIESCLNKYNLSE
jgi:restriction endonuclease S subunit